LCSAAYASSQKKTVRKDLANLYGHYLKGYLLQKMNVDEAKSVTEQRFSIALNEYTSALQYFPESSRIYLNMGVLEMGLKDFTKAEEFLNKALELDEENLGASFILAFLYAHLKNETKMNAVYERFLKQAHRLQPENLQISEYLGQFYFEKGNVEEASNVYRMLVSVHPDYVNGYFWLGFLAESQGKRKEAISFWEKTIQMDPNHADALNSLGYLYAEEGTRLQEANLLVRKALELRPDEGAYLDSLGWIYYRLGDYPKAEFYLKKASEHMNDHVILYHLGEVCKAMQKKDDACKWWKKSIEVKKAENPSQERVDHECSSK